MLSTVAIGSRIHAKTRTCNWRFTVSLLSLLLVSAPTVEKLSGFSHRNFMKFPDLFTTILVETCEFHTNLTRSIQIFIPN